MLGQTIGKYRIVERLGRGGMGTVYKAVDETLDREVAIKVLNPGLADSDLLKRFRAEAIALAKLNHPHIATIYELNKHDDELLMVMEFVRGESFDKLSDRVGPMPFERAAYLCGQVLDALAHAHRAGIVHRDLKPANIMLSDTGVVKVMDFGIARVAGTEHLTTDGFMMGTPAYMAPEQVMGQEVDGRADLYSIGVVLYRLLTANLPFKADTAIAMVQKQIKDPPTPLRQFRAELPVWCEQILMRALAKAPSDRYQTADEFRGALTLSVAMAPASDVTTVLASPSAAPPELEMTVAPDSMPSQPSESSASPSPPAALSPAPAAVPPSSSAAGAPVAAVAAVAVAAARAGKPEEPTIVLRKSQVRSVGLLAMVVLAAVAVGALLMIRRGPASTQSGATPPSALTPPPTATETPDAPPATAPPPAATSTAPPPGTTPPSQAPATSPERTASSAPAPRTDPPRTPPAAKPDVPTAPALPALVFTPVRLLMFGDRAREREATLRLDQGALRLVDPKNTDDVLKSIPYPSMLAIFHSKSREPRWVGPNGVVNPVGKVEGGVFGFLRGDRDWLTVRTAKEFVPLRLDESVLKRVAAALEERTRLTVIRADRSARRD